jgi:hypothetical protein
MLKRILVTVAIIGVTAASYGQGTVFFDNDMGARVAPVTDVGVTNRLSGSGFSAQLFAASGINAPSNSLVAAESRVQFRTGSNVGFVPTSTVTINSFTGSAVDPTVTVTPTEGGPATVQMRAWDAAFPTYDAAIAGNGKYGWSNILNLPATGGGLTPPVNLVGLQGFSLVQVPEPSTIALGAFGLAALLFRRRK